MLADSKCNRKKLDHLAAASHVERWTARARRYATDLVALAEEVDWKRHPEQTAGVARSIYFGLPDGAMLWESEKAFVAIDRVVVSRALGEVAAAPDKMSTTQR